MSGSSDIGMRLRELRKKRGLTQRELASMVNVSFMTMRRWEASEHSPRIEEIKKLARALNVTEGELLSDSQDETWTLEIKIDNTVKEMIDMTENMPCIASITGTQNGALLTLSGKWDTFRDDAKFQDFIDQLVRARTKILRLGEDWANE